MPTIYNFDPNRIYTYQTREIAEDAGAPPDWTFNAPPSFPADKFASFRGPDWVILDEYPKTYAPAEPVAPNPADAITEPVVI
jgi:hypothetical protein